MGRVQFTNTDSDGNPVTNELAITIDGDRYVIGVASTGTVMVSDEVEEHLVESPDYQVESYTSDTTDDED